MLRIPGGHQGSGGCRRCPGQHEVTIRTLYITGKHHRDDPTGIHLVDLVARALQAARSFKPAGTVKDRRGRMPRIDPGARQASCIRNQVGAPVAAQRLAGHVAAARADWNPQFTSGAMATQRQGIGEIDPDRIARLNVAEAQLEKIVAQALDQRRPLAAAAALVIARPCLSGRLHPGLHPPVADRHHALMDRRVGWQRKGVDHIDRVRSLVLEFLLQADLRTIAGDLEADVNRPQRQRNPSPLFQQGGESGGQKTFGTGELGGGFLHSKREYNSFSNSIRTAGGTFRPNGLTRMKSSPIRHDGHFRAGSGFAGARSVASTCSLSARSASSSLPRRLSATSARVAPAICRARQTRICS